MGLQISCGILYRGEERSIFSGARREHLGEVFHECASRKEAKIVEGCVLGAYVHMCINIPPKHAVSNVVGYMKDKSAIRIARKFGGRQKNFTGKHFWAMGYFMYTAGLDEDIVCAYLRNREQEAERCDQLKLEMRRAAKSGSRFHGHL